MARSTAPVSQLPSPSSLDFLHFLCRSEAAVQSVSALPASGHDGEEDPSCGSTDDDVDEIWRSKICAYERTLRDKLSQWKGLDQATLEVYRSRIEDLMPALERSLDMRRVAAAKLDPASVADAPVVPAAIAAAKAEAETAAAAAAAAADAELRASAVDIGSAAGTALADAVEMTAAELSKGDSAAREAQTRTHMSSAKESPWGRPSARSFKAGKPSAEGESNKIKKEMEDMTEGMIGIAQSFNKTLKRDIEVLEEVGDSQDKNLDKVKGENKKARALLWSGQLSWITTMIMLAVSIVIFFSMIPFIIFT